MKPAVGQYYPHFKYILPFSPQWKQGKAKKISIFEECANKQNCDREKEQLMNIKYKEKVKGFVKFSEQLNRGSVKSANNSPHEARFVSFNNNPSISTSYKYY